MISNNTFFLVPLMSEALSSFDDLHGLLSYTFLLCCPTPYSLALSEHC